MFRSRWAALFWAAGIVWTAYDVASDTPPLQHTPPASGNVAEPATDATGEVVNTADLAVLANVMGTP